MQDKVILVTGAAGVLGSKLVELALARGAQVCGLDRGELQKPGRSLSSLQLGGVDLTEYAQADAAIETAVKYFGHLDVLVNVAGSFAYEKVDEGSARTWLSLYETNVLTAVNASRAADPFLRRSSAGRIVNVGAMGALRADAGFGPYAASKSGVHRLTEALASELKGKVSVNAVLPSILDTPSNRKSMPNMDFSKWVTPEELANVILFLASDQGGAITGALIPVNGSV